MYLLSSGIMLVNANSGCWQVVVAIFETVACVCLDFGLLFTFEVVVCEQISQLVH